MKLNNIIKFSLMASAALSASGTVHGAVSAGSLVLFFQTRGAEGSGKGVYVNLGNAATLFRGDEAGPSTAQQRLDFINIGTTLVSAYGAGWASDPDLYAGVAGVFSNIDSPTIVDGDQYRTLYASKARNSVGTVGLSGTTQWNLDSKGSLTNGATNMLSLATNFATLLGSADQGVVADTAIRNQNPFNASGSQQTAFGQFDGGVQQRGSVGMIGNFGYGGDVYAENVEFALDIQRLVPDGTVDPGEVVGPRRKGTFEGTLTIDTNGSVSFITIPEPSSVTLVGITGLALAFRRRRIA